MSAVELVDESKGVSQMKMRSAAVDPEIVPTSDPNNDELVLARFGKKQQLRVSVL
jgi:hypothetical protein